MKEFNNTSFYKEIEAFEKIICYKIKQNNYISATNELIWLDKYINQIFNLQKNNYNKFKNLIDPYNEFYFNVQSNVIDINNISFSQIKFSESKPTIEVEKPKDSLYRKIIHDISSFKTTINNDFFNQTISSLHNIYLQSIKKGQKRLSMLCIYIIQNLLSIIYYSSNELLDFTKIFNKISFIINQYNIRILDNTSNSKFEELFVFKVSIEGFIHLLRKDNYDDISVDFNKLNIIKNNLKFNLTNALRKGNISSFKNIIDTLVDSHFEPYYNDVYIELYRFVREKSSVRQDNEILKSIPDITWRDLQNLRSESDWKKWKVKLDKLKLQLEELIKENLEDYFTKILNFSYKYIRYNSIQIIIVEIIIFLLFKRRYDLVKYAYRYNQPEDNDAIWSNKEIVPIDITTIVDLFRFSSNIESDLMEIWDGHHGINKYINLFFIVSFYYSIKLGNKYSSAEESFNRILSNSDNSQHISNLKYILSILNKSFKGEIDKKNSLFNNKSQNEQLIKFFDNSIEKCNNRLGSLEIQSSIYDETKLKFINSILDSYYNRAAFYQIYDHYNLIKNEEVDKLQINKITISINEFINRTVLVQDCYIPTYGFYETRGKHLADLENWQIFQKMKEFSSQTLDIDFSTIPNCLDQYDDYDIVITDLHIDLLLSKISTVKYANKIEGIDYDKIPSLICLWHNKKIFHLSLPIETNEILLLNSLQLGNLYNTSQDNQLTKISLGFYYKLADLASEEDSLSNLLEDPPIWLNEEISNDESKKLDYLKKKLWIVLQKKSFLDILKPFNPISIKVSH